MTTGNKPPPRNTPESLWMWIKEMKRYGPVLLLLIGLFLLMESRPVAQTLAPIPAGIWSCANGGLVYLQPPAVWPPDPSKPPQYRCVDPSAVGTEWSSFVQNFGVGTPCPTTATGKQYAQVVDQSGTPNGNCLPVVTQ